MPEVAAVDQEAARLMVPMAGLGVALQHQLREALVVTVTHRQSPALLFKEAMAAALAVMAVCFWRQVGAARVRLAAMVIQAQRQ